MAMAMSAESSLLKSVGFHIAPDEALLLRRLRSHILGETVDDLKNFPIVVRDLYSTEPWNVFNNEDPWEITKDYQENKSCRTIYVFTALKPSGEKRYFRSAGIGTWSSNTSEKDVRSHPDGPVIGSTRSLNFQNKKGNKEKILGEWIMHEYKLDGDSFIGFSSDSISRAKVQVICKIKHVVDRELGVHNSWPKTPLDNLIDDFKRRRYFAKKETTNDVTRQGI